MLSKSLKLLLLLCIAGSAVCEDEYRKVCYYESWAKSRQDFLDLNPYECTHMVYSFSKLFHLIPRAIENDMVAVHHQRALRLKSKNKNLKLIFSSGEGSTQFANAVKDIETVQNFTSGTINFLRTLNFDGIDIGWDIDPKQKTKLTHLLENFRMQLDTEAAETEKNPLLLSITIPPFGESAYEIRKLQHLVDWVNLNTFNKQDFNHLKNFHAQKSSKKKRVFNIDVDAAVDKWLSKGFPADKINLGIAVISRTYNTTAKTKASSQKESDEDLSVAEKKQKELDEHAISTKICDLTSMGNIAKTYGKASPAKVSLGVELDRVAKKCLGGFSLWMVDIEDPGNKICKNPDVSIRETLRDQLTSRSCEEKKPLKASIEPVVATNNTVNSTVSATTTKAATTQKVLNETTTKSEQTTTASSTTTTLSTTTLTTNKTTTANSKKVETTTAPLNKTTTSTKVSKGKSTTTAAKEKSESKKANNHRPILSFDVVSRPKPESLVAELDVKELKNKTQSEKNKTATTTPTASSTKAASTSTASSTSTTSPSTTTTSKAKLFSTTKRRKYVRPVQKVTKFVQKKPPRKKHRRPGIESLFNITLPTQPQQFTCPEPTGLFPYEELTQCNQYYFCSNNFAMIKKCPGNLLFNPDSSACEFTSPLCSLKDLVNTTPATTTKPRTGKRRKNMGRLNLDWINFL